VGHVSQQRTEAHDHLHTQLAREAGDVLAEAAPVELGLHAVQEDDVVAAPGQRGGGQLVGGPLDGAGDAVDEPHLRPGAGEVVELLRIEAGERAGGPGVGQVPRRRRSGVTRVVPALEGGDEHGRPQGGSVLPAHVVHAANVPVLPFQQLRTGLVTRPP
jgi:hypothetical protein